MVQLHDPLDTAIASRRPLVGLVIRGYKNLIKRLLDPYLRHVFDREHENLNLINHRLERTDQRLDLIEHQMRQALSDIESLKRQWHDMSIELIDRMDSLTLFLNHRYSEMDAQIREINTLDQGFPPTEINGANGEK
jgi:hypothetical protein